MAKEKTRKPEVAVAASPEHSAGAAGAEKAVVERVRQDSPGVIAKIGFEKPFAAKAIKWKPQMVKGNRCLAIAYIDARLVMDRLDEVVGVAGWSDDYQLLSDGSVMCRLTVRLGGIPVTKCDVGSPSQQPDAGDRMKSACSDALKRAAVKFGIGRYLYRIPSQWVDYDAIKRQITSPPRLPDWAIPKAAAENYSYHDDEAAEVAEVAAAASAQHENPPAKTQPNGQPKGDGVGGLDAEKEFDVAFSAVQDLDDMNALLAKAKALPESSKKTAWESMLKLSKESGWRFNQGTSKFEKDPRFKPNTTPF